LKFNSPLMDGRLLKRYKRFFADVVLSSGEMVTAHCPNTGSMKTCLGDGWPVRISQSDNPKRKLKFTLEMIYNGKCWIGLNTILANKIVKEGIGMGKIPELTGYPQIKSEVLFGKNSRVDLLLTENVATSRSLLGKLKDLDPRTLAKKYLKKTSRSKKYKKKVPCYVEVKNVTLVQNGFFEFPDSPTERGLKHLHELQAQVRKGNRAVMFFLIQRNDGKGFKPAESIDPIYAKKLIQVWKKGVEVLAYRSRISKNGIFVGKKEPLAFEG